MFENGWLPWANQKISFLKGKNYGIKQFAINGTSHSMEKLRLLQEVRLEHLCGCKESTKGSVVPLIIRDKCRKYVWVLCCEDTVPLQVTSTNWILRIWKRHARGRESFFHSCLTKLGAPFGTTPHYPWVFSDPFVDSLHPQRCSNQPNTWSWATTHGTSVSNDISNRFAWFVSSRFPPFSHYNQWLFTVLRTQKSWRITYKAFASL